ncbi:pyridoxal-phosphate-dependent aminotransferase family protein [Mesoaciditoga sp.]
MIKKTRIMTPGPTPVPVEVLLEGAKETIAHRTPEFKKMLKDASEKLKSVFRTDEHVFILSSSGTGALETAVANTVSPEDKVITVVGGKFGERWAELCQAYGANMVKIEVEWGELAEPMQIEKALNENPDTKVVFTTLSETSTGVVYDIKAFAEIVKKTDAILVVDAVSGLIAEPLEMAEWGVDIAVAGSQKAFMMPPGLAFVAVNGEKAWKRIEESNSPRYYFDLRAYKKKYPDTPYTGAVNLVYQLNKALDMIENEGMENIWKRHALFAEAMRNGVKAIGLELLPKKPGNVLTAVKIPEGIDGGEFLKVAREKYGMYFSGGQGKLTGKIFRASNLGYVDRLDMISAMAVIEMVLSDLGKKVPIGAGVKAVEETLIRGER